MDSTILEFVKKAVGSDPTDDIFDEELLSDINVCFFDLNQLGVGPEEPFVVSELTEWTEFTNSASLIETIKAYLQIRVTLLFDPPSSSSILSAKQEQANKIEWRLSVSQNSKIQNEKNKEA